MEDMMTDKELDIFFQAAREAQISPSPELMARVMDDAMRLMPKQEPMVQEGVSVWKRLFGSLKSGLRHPIAWPAPAAFAAMAYFMIVPPVDNHIDFLIEFDNEIAAEEFITQVFDGVSQEET